MPNFDFGFFVKVTILVTSSWPVLAQPQCLQPAAAPFGNPSQQLQQDDAAQKPIMSNGPDMVLLSSRYNKQRFSDEGVGKVMNNDTESAELVEVLATFRDASGAVIDTATGYADPHLVTAGDSAPFNILLTSEIIEDKATSYDLTLKWRDLDFEEFSKDVLRGQPLNGEVSNEEDDNGSDGNDDNDDNGYGCEPNLKCQLEENREWAKDHIENFDELDEEEQESMINEVLDDANEDYLDAQEEKKEEDGRENEGADDGNSEDNQ